MSKQIKYLAFLDILGFKDLIENNSLEEVCELYDNFEPSLLFSVAMSNIKYRLDNLQNFNLPPIEQTHLNSLFRSEKMNPKIVETLKSREFQNMIVDISETTLDSFLDDDIVKDIPIFGLLFKGKNLISTIQDKLFLKKLLKFLKQLEDTTPEERMEQINEIEQNPKYRTKIGEKLMYLIDKCEDSEKAEILGVLFKNFIMKKISYDNLLRCTNSINSLSTRDIEAFVKKDTFIEAFIKTKANIYLNSGLVNFKLRSNLQRKDRAINTEDIEVIYVPSDLGELLKTILKKYYS